MVSEIKHRKSGSSPNGAHHHSSGDSVSISSNTSGSRHHHSSSDSVSSCSASGRQSPSKHNRPTAHSTRARRGAQLFLAFSALSLFITFMPSSIHLNLHNLRAHSPDLQTANSQPLPYSELELLINLQNEALKRGEEPGPSSLTGVYILGKDYLLYNAATATSNAGSIQYPYADLSSIIAEEALQYQRQIMMVNVGAQPQPDQSFLSDDPSIKSAIPTINSDIINNDHALLTRRGFKMGDVPNQDRSFIANFPLGVNKGQSATDKAIAQKEQTQQIALLMGIFDGHGPKGHSVSHHITINLPSVFASIMREKQKSQAQPILGSLANPKEEQHTVNYIRQSLIETFIRVDENEPVKGTAGSTASVLFYPGIGSKVYIANTGDSTTLVVRYHRPSRSSTIVFQNRKHKPHLPGERQRIEKAGGQVMIPPSLMQGGGGGNNAIQETSRVIIPDATGNPLGGLALAMSRSIGDFDGKSVGLIAEPDVEVWDVNAHYREYPEQKEDVEWFAVIASDGLYDVLTPDRVVEYLSWSLYHDQHSSNIPPLVACERLIREASRLWMKLSLGVVYRDDITVGVSKIKFASI